MEVVVEPDSKSEQDSQDASSTPRLLTLDDLRQMDWKRFEELAQGYFQYKGYDARLTGSGADGGVDVTLEKTTSEGKRLTVYVQCKAWANQKVGVKAVRELYGVMAADGIAIGVFITASDFTEDALTFARGKKLQLISGSKLLSLIGQLSEAQQQELAARILAGITRHHHARHVISKWCSERSRKEAIKAINSGGAVTFHSAIKSCT